MDVKEILLNKEDLIDWWNKTKIEDSNKYSTLLDTYNKLIDIIAKLIKELSLPNNPISMAIITNRLLHLGYFSMDNMFIPCNTKKDIKTRLGINVIKGIGSCRHVGYFYKDISNKNNVFCENFFCSPTDMDINAQATHVASLIKYNGEYYVFDVYNDGLYEFISPLTVKEMCNRFNTSLHYKPQLQLIIDGLSKDHIENNLKLFMKSSNNKHIELSEYKEILNDSSESITINSNIISDYLVTTHPIKKEFREKIKCIKMDEK